jgi:hypothetical protein
MVKLENWFQIHAPRKYGFLGIEAHNVTLDTNQILGWQTQMNKGWDLTSPCTTTISDLLCGPPLFSPQQSYTLDEV